MSSYAGDEEIFPGHQADKAEQTTSPLRQHTPPCTLGEVRSIARRMITEWGYGGDQLGATAWESPDGGRMSQATEEAIDQEVAAFL